MKTVHEKVELDKISCPICPVRTFNHHSKLSEHMIKQHNGGVKKNCPMCNFTSFNAAKMKSHMEERHLTLFEMTVS